MRNILYHKVTKGTKKKGFASQTRNLLTGKEVRREEKFYRLVGEMLC